MSDPHAAGRKTEPLRFVSGQVEQLLENQIAQLGEHAAFCLAAARDVAPQDDGYGHARQAQVSDAIALAKMSGKLALTISRMSGEVSYNFNYNHSQKDVKPPGRKDVRDMSPDELREVPMTDLPRNVPICLEERRRRIREQIAEEERYRAEVAAEQAQAPDALDDARAKIVGLLQAQGEGDA